MQNLKSKVLLIIADVLIMALLFYGTFRGYSYDRAVWFIRPVCAILFFLVLAGDVVLILMYLFPKMETEIITNNELIRIRHALEIVEAYEKKGGK